MSASSSAERDRGVSDVVQSGRDDPQQFMARDKKTAHGPLREESAVYLGSDDIAVDRYISPDFHKQEIEKVWRKTWQVACHESELADIGDTVVYTIGRWSILVVRSASNVVKAFYNSCLHRGTELKCADGNVGEFRCPFHGWTYDLEGRLTDLPEAWDFSRIDLNSTRLPEVKVGIWGGWIFVNMDSSCISLEEYLGPVRKHFDEIRPFRRYVASHTVIRNIPSNWKVTQEAFLEVYHCDETHPQLMVATNCYDAENSVYLDGGHLNSRLIVPVAVPTASEHHQMSEQDVIDSLFADRVRGQASLGRALEMVKVPELAEGEKARPYAAEVIREFKQAALGTDLSEASDSEVMDAIEYFCFPNFMPWAGYQNCMAYRFRPDGNDPDRSIMDVWLLNPVNDADIAIPHAPAPVIADCEAGIGHLEALGRFRLVLQQDLDNLPRVQRGLHTSAKGAVSLADYQEVRIRHFHQTLDRYLGEA